MHNRIYGNDKILYRGQSLMLQWRGGREFVARKGVSGVVAVIAITDEGEVLLLDNYRPALRENIIELPGGLAGDLPGREHETLADAALRELREETGFITHGCQPIGEGPSSAGISNEVVSFFLAMPAVCESAPDDEETSRLLRVPLVDIDDWLKKQRAKGRLVDYRIPAALYLATSYLKETPDIYNKFHAAG